MLKPIKRLFHLFSQKTYWGQKASGIMYICPEDETILLLRRAKHIDQPNTWGIAGGALTEGFFPNNHNEEDPSDVIFLESAKREVNEEIGVIPESNILVEMTTFKDKGFTYKTFIYAIDLEIKSNLNIVLSNEHTEYRWFKFDNLPKNLHFGVKYSLDCVGL